MSLRGHCTHNVETSFKGFTDPLKYMQHTDKVIIMETMLSTIWVVPKIHLSKIYRTKLNKY